MTPSGRSVVETLRAARKLIEKRDERNWFARFFRPRSKFYALDVLEEIADERHFLDCVRAVQDQMGRGIAYFITFNTNAEVLAAFDRAIEQADSLSRKEG